MTDNVHLDVDVSQVPVSSKHLLNVPIKERSVRIVSY